MIFLRKGTCSAKQCCCHCDGKTVEFRNHINHSFDELCRFWKSFRNGRPAKEV
jgi:hypothetical protein